MPKKSESKTNKKEKISKEKTKSVKLTENVFENKVIDLAKKGLTSEKIGESLRKEGIHPGEYEKKISKILKENNLYINPDIKNVEAKLKRVQAHYDKNKQDKRAMREKDRVFAQYRKLKEHYG